MQNNNLLNTPLLEIIKNNNLFYDKLPFDEYHLVMAATDVLENMQATPTIKTYFYRRPPFEASYSIFAGLSVLLAKLSSFSYKTIIPYLQQNNYDNKFIDYLKTRDKLQLRVYSLPDNSVVFANEPIVIFECPLIDSRIIEGMILSELNFATLSATKWARIVTAASGCPVSEFGRRRAQNSLKASLNAYISGTTTTSNCEANDYFGIPSSGTMGHEFVQSYDSEFDAFDKWLKNNPTKPCLLVDTIHTLESGVVNACKAFIKNKQLLLDNNSWEKIAIRIDSGDLAYLAVSCYDYMHNKLSPSDISIVLSNDLDEYSIESIFTQLINAKRLDVADKLVFGVGTKGAVAWGEPAFNGVCKMSVYDGDNIIKLSNQKEKTTIPGNIRSSVITDSNGEFVTNLIYLCDENVSEIDSFRHPNDSFKFINNCDKYSKIEHRQKIVYTSDGSDSQFVSEFALQSLNDIRKNSKQILDTLDWTYKRFTNSHYAKVSLSPKLFNLRYDMIKSGNFKL